MTRLIVVVSAIVVLLAGAAFAQGPDGTLALFSDPAGTDCSIYDYDVGLLRVYVFYIWHNGTQHVQFSAPSPPCFTDAWLGDRAIHPFTSGTSHAGITIDFGTCSPAPIHVLSIDYFVEGDTPACCYYPVLPDPAVPSGRIEAGDCMGHIVYPTAGRAIINPDASCPCTYPVPVEQTTWGQIKALYTD